MINWASDFHKKIKTWMQLFQDAEERDNESVCAVYNAVRLRVNVEDEVSPQRIHRM